MEDYTKSNILIATKLMGGVKELICDDPVVDEEYWVINFKGYSTEVDDLDYEDNWKKIMVVVETVEKQDSGRYGFSMDSLGVEIYDYLENNTLVNVDRYDGETRIEMLYEAILRFIKYLYPEC